MTSEVRDRIPGARKHRGDAADQTVDNVPTDLAHPPRNIYKDRPQEPDKAVDDAAPKIQARLNTVAEDLPEPCEDPTDHLQESIEGGLKDRKSTRLNSSHVAISY